MQHTDIRWRRHVTTIGLVVSMTALLGAALAITRAAEPRGEERAVKARLAPSSLLLDLATSGGTTLAVGERGHILVSRDAGATWAQADVPTRALLTGVCLVDDKTGFAVGHDEVIVRTRDGGTTWQRVHHAPETEKPLLDVWFADATHGIASGAYGGLLVTADGGDTWETRAILGDDDFHLNAMASGGDGTWYLAAEAGHLYRSEDRGTSWQALASPYDGSWFGLLPMPDGRLLVFGLRGHLYQSADRGTTWTAIASGTEETLTTGLALEGGRFVIGGMGGTLLWGDGAGVRRQELPDRKGVSALMRGGDGRLVLAGEAGLQHVEIPR